MSSCSAIGRIVCSRDKPAKPYEFWCWLNSELSRDIQVGSILSVSNENERIVVVVEDLSNESTLESETEFYSHEMGNPNISPPTAPTIIKYAKLRVLSRNPPIIKPPLRWIVRRISPEEVNTELMGAIPERNRIVAGFLRIGSWAPIYYSSEHLLGYETAHVNITGVTGMATKTSYALFLAYSIYSWAYKNKKKVAIILFNVKREDFLGLHLLPKNWDEAKKWIETWSEGIGDHEKALEQIELWESAKNVGVDPIKLNVPVQYFTYQNDPYYNSELTTIKKDGVETKANVFSYGLKDLTADELVTALYQPEESADIQISLIHETMNKQNVTSFDTLLSELHSMLSSRQTTWFPQTIYAVINRVNGLLGRAQNIIEKSVAHSNPITFEKLSEGFNVIQLYGLSEQEKRLTVNSVMGKIKDGMERSKKFDRVVVVVDELNVYAPKSKSVIKDQIVDIVARGRDLGLSLMGAQQFASNIDDQVLGNSLTRVVGYSERSEVADPLYRFLGEFKDRATELEKGEMIVKHPTYKSPFIICFPVPLHRIRTRG